MASKHPKTRNPREGTVDEAEQCRDSLRTALVAGQVGIEVLDR